MKNKFKIGTRLGLLIAALLISGATLLVPHLVKAPIALAYSLNSGYGWDISSFKDDVKINSDSTITVKETIVADYSQEEHHGLIRSIPIKYKDDFHNNLNLRFDLISVTDENGRPWTYSQYYEGEYVKIQIGDPDIYLNQPSTFVITYNLARAVTYFKDHDELYWNVTGTETEVPTLVVDSTITLPTAVKKADLQATCITGVYGSKATDCGFTIEDGQVKTKVNKELEPLEGLTVVFGFPKGTVTKPSIVQEILWILKDNWGYALPFLTFAILFYLWYTRGRDPKSRDTIMPIYTAPNNLTPSEIGTIIDERVDMRDISSAIIDFAVRGYLKIVETKGKKLLLFSSDEIEFQKLKDFSNDSKLKPHEKTILTAIFGTSDSATLSSLKNQFYTNLPIIKKQIYDQLVQDGYFPTNPENVRKIYTGFGTSILVVMIFGAQFVILFLGLHIIVGVALSAIILIVFAKFMPAKTKKGVDTWYQIKGLEEFINTAEKDRLKFQEKENIFEKILPYAMALGIAAKWSKAFEGLNKTPPGWYSSNDPNFGANFSTYYLFSRLDHLSNNMQTTFQSSPRSSSSGSSWGGSSGFGGGGFSGGGFGGGGSSSW